MRHCTPPTLQHHCVTEHHSTALHLCATAHHSTAQHHCITAQYSTPHHTTPSLHTTAHHSTTPLRHFTAQHNTTPLRHCTPQTAHHTTAHHHCVTAHHRIAHHSVTAHHTTAQNHSVTAHHSTSQRRHSTQHHTGGSCPPTVRCVPHPDSAEPPALGRDKARKGPLALPLSLTLAPALTRSLSFLHARNIFPNFSLQVARCFLEFSSAYFSLRRSFLVSVFRFFFEGARGSRLTSWKLWPIRYMRVAEESGPCTPGGRNGAVEGSVHCGAAEGNNVRPQNNSHDGGVFLNISSPKITYLTRLS